MKAISKSLLLLSLLFIAVSSVDAKDKYSFSFIDSKVYSGKTDVWRYQVYKNDKKLKKLEVFIADDFEGTRILVEYNFNTSSNMYIFEKRKNEQNLFDSFRNRQYTVETLKQAVEQSVANYISDQIAD
jgi:hypothetical protein